jgi:glycosyltransferase involved in cell wall biosynthesis
MARIRVLHLLSRFNYGGTERQLVERLRRHPPGFEGVLGCFEAWGVFLDPIRALGYEPHVLPLRGLARPEAAVQVWRAAALIRRERIGLVHANDFATSVVGVAASRLAGVPVIVNRVDLGHLRPGFGKWHRRLEMLAARQATLVCANAEAVRRVCIEEEGCRPDQVVVVRNGLDIQHFDELSASAGAPLPTRDGDFVVAVIGNLWPVKAHRVLLEAAALLRDTPIRFVCAGEGSERAQLERRIRELDLSNTVFLLGHRQDVPALLSRSHALCLCSTAEGLSNAVTEAMAARLPVVATNVGGTPELVEDGTTGFLVPPGDPRELARRLRQVYASPERARQMGERGRAFVEKHLSLENLTDAHEALYRRAVGLSSRPQGTAAGRPPPAERAAT